MAEIDRHRLDYPKDAASLRDEIREMLVASVCDNNSSADTGGGIGQADLWVTVQGVEYFITVRKSNGQVLRERQP